jgi:hypothetical protein
VVEEIVTGLGADRDQIETKESAAFLRTRHHVLSMIRQMRRSAKLN